MENHNIKPEKITKPIQLLAVWLIGLILLVSALLTAAGTVKEPSWLPGFFSISAVSIIPLFLGLIFLLQTRFRPQMQEDEYYSKYLNKNTLEYETKINDKTIEILVQKVDDKIIELSTITKEQITMLNETVSELIKEPTINKNNLLLDKKANEIKRFDQFIQSTTTVYLNKYLEYYKEINSKLSANNYTVNNYFGDENEPLKMFLLSFGTNVEVGLLKFLINELKNLDLTHIRANEKDSPVIYIGSYAYKTEKIAILDSKLLKTINEADTTQEIFAEVLRKQIKI